MNQFDTTIFTASTWVLPLLFAITLHEAAHGFVAHKLGDNTAFRLGRVSFNPLRHIDPFGTVLLPAFLLLMHAPFLFGYAKPVPVNFRALRNPRRDMILVAAAGPAANILMMIAAGVLVHVSTSLPAYIARWFLINLINALQINAVLAIFNLLPIPPLDGSRILVGLLPGIFAVPFARLEQYGMLILIGMLFILPILGQQIGMNLNVFAWIVGIPANALLGSILHLTGNT